MEKLYSIPDLYQLHVESIAKIHQELEINAFAPLIAEDDLILEYLLRIYYTGGKGLVSRVKKFAHQHNMFKFLLIVTGGSVELTKKALRRDISEDKLALCEHHIESRELKIFLSSKHYCLSDLIENFYILRPFMKRYELQIVFTLKKYIIKYPDRLLDIKSFHACLVELIKNKEFAYELERLRPPLNLEALHLPEVIKIKEIITIADLENEGDKMGNCLGINDYDFQIKSRRLRIYNLKYKKLSANLEIITPKLGAPYIGELKMRFKEPPVKVLIYIANYIVKKLSKLHESKTRASESSDKIVSRRF